LWKTAAFIAITAGWGKPVNTTADQKEIDNFAAMSAHWWDERGPMAPLHAFAPVRIDYILDSVRRIGTSRDDRLDGLRILDIGCGGGILAEPMARLGGQVTGIDATPQAIEAATAHATAVGLTIDYRCTTAEALAETGAQYDLVYASEVIEHVTDRRLFAAATAALLAPGGTIVITTINRTLAAFALAKVALEYVLRTVPAGTHDPARFVKPAELRDEFAGAGIMLDDMTGFAPLPARRIGGNGFMRVGSLAVNYGASGTHA
jgi:2-polyprenyl-6-hydroxyphenyl methylase/3-demethylubiquinone-9 3-methyltransferase